MESRRYSITRERDFEDPLRAVWAIAADTNRWDRAAGLSAGRYTWRDDEAGVRVRVASASELGFEIEWIEPPYEWIEGRFVHGERRFLKGPVASGGFTAWFREVEGRTRVSATPFVAGSGMLAAVVGRVMTLRFFAAIERYFDALERALSSREPNVPGVGPAMAASSGLLRRSRDHVIVGPRSETDGEELERRALALRATDSDPAVVEALLAWLCERPDEDVAQMRPFELARLWGADRRATLRVFLRRLLSCTRSRRNAKTRPMRGRGCGPAVSGGSRVLCGVLPHVRRVRHDDAVAGRANTVLLAPGRVGAKS